MTCLSREDLALRRTAQSPAPALTGAELAHIGSCPRCAALAAESTAGAGMPARDAAERRPDARYWASIVPRVRERIRAEEAGAARSGFAALARTLMPVAAAVATVIALAVTSLEPPARLNGGQLLATLSDIELQELRQSGTYTNLLDSHEWNGEGETSLAELIADLLMEDEHGGLEAIADPEEVLRHADEGDIVEIVGNIDYQ